MTTVKRPPRSFPFTDWTKYHPRDPHPGDRLDAMFIELSEAIRTTQDALAQIRQPNGELAKRSIGVEHFKTDIASEIVQRIGDAVEPLTHVINAATDAVRHLEQNAALYAADAEAAVDVAKGLVAGLAPITDSIAEHLALNANAADAADSFATDSENWANYSLAQADNAIAAKNEALQWAEYLAGPVVDSGHAPAYIAASPFPHGLYYQPVEGGIAGLWSAKWWALYAQNIAGKTGIFYLGSWPTPPLGGEQNPGTGQVVPNPIPPGSFYYDEASNTVKVWNGSAWIAPIALGQGYQGSYLYVATAGQTSFSGADINGLTPAVGTSPSSVYVNGVHLVPTLDYVVDAPTNKLTIASPLTAGSSVQWDLLVPSSMLAPSSVITYKMNAIAPDGVKQDFTLLYFDGSTTVNPNIGDGVQLQVSVDGAIQEPGGDYTASGSSIHFLVPPLITARVWIVWFKPGGP